MDDSVMLRNLFKITIVIFYFDRYIYLFQYSGLKMTTSLSRKFDESSARKNGGWHSEIEQLSSENANIEVSMPSYDIDNYV